MVKSNTIEVVRGATETNMSVMRRFSRRVSGSGIVRSSRNNRYNERTKSTLKQKREALKRMAKREIYERLKKLGKIKDVKYRHR
jgi:ribosomal protein S21